MYSQLCTYPFKIVCLFRTWNLVDVASAKENVFCTAVSVASVLILHYSGLCIGGCDLTCLVQSPIYLLTDHRLFHGVTYLYKWYI